MASCASDLLCYCGRDTPVVGMLVPDNMSNSGSMMTPFRMTGRNLTARAWSATRRAFRPQCWLSFKPPPLTSASVQLSQRPVFHELLRPLPSRAGRFFPVQRT